MYEQTRDNFVKRYCSKGNIRNFRKLKVTLVFDKILHYTKRLLLKNPYVFLANFIFVVSHLKIYLAVHLNTSKPLTKKKSLIKAYSLSLVLCSNLG